MPQLAATMEILLGERNRTGRAHCGATEEMIATCWKAALPSPTKRCRAWSPLSRGAGEERWLSPSPALRERVASAARRVRVLPRSPIILANSRCTMQLIKGGHKSGGEAALRASDETMFNYAARFCCRFAADSAIGNSPIQLLIGSQGIYWTAEDCGAF